MEITTSKSYLMPEVPAKKTNKKRVQNNKKTIKTIIMMTIQKSQSTLIEVESTNGCALTFSSLNKAHRLLL
jgi:hypothetical protein